MDIEKKNSNYLLSYTTYLFVVTILVPNITNMRYFNMYVWLYKLYVFIFTWVFCESIHRNKYKSPLVFLSVCYSTAKLMHRF